MYDLKQFSAEPVEIHIEHQGKDLMFYVKQVSVQNFFDQLKGSNNPTANMRKTFRTLLLDEEQEAVPKEWIEELVTNDAVLPLALKINAAINTALGLDELAAKKG
jgi:hypothetical protein